MVELRTVNVSSMGLDNDREYMVVREEAGADGIRSLLTQRDKRHRLESKPQSLAILALIHPEVTESSLRLTWKGGDGIVIPKGQNGREVRVRIHTNVVFAADQGDAAAAWLSDHLGVRSRLVRATGAIHRMASQRFLPNSNQIRFQDAFPIHWVTQESVDELSMMAGQSIPWTRFRPNVVGEGGEPQVEHEIYEGGMGAVRFVQPKPCTRCPVTTVDQEAGEKRGNEPLTALSKYKRWNATRELLFGENALPLSGGSMKVGDEILEYRARQPPIVYGRETSHV